MGSDAAADLVGELRKVAAALDDLPPRPWSAVERSHLELYGPAEWDPVEQPDRDVHVRTEQARAARTAWRGIVAADGTTVVGEHLDLSSPPSPVHGRWRQVAELAGLADTALAAARQLWRTETTPPAASTAEPTADVTGDVSSEQLARVCFEAAPDPAGKSWAALSLAERYEWEMRARAVLALGAERRS